MRAVLLPVGIWFTAIAATTPGLQPLHVLVGGISLGAYIAITKEN